MTDYILNKGQLPANELAGLLETNPGNIRIATWTVAVTTCPDTANLFIQPHLSFTVRHNETISFSA